MAMSRAGLAVGAIATIALAGCGGGNGNTGNEVHGGARVVVAEHHRERADGALYVEGAVQYVELIASGARDPAVKLELAGAAAVRNVNPGDYRVVSYTRTCSGTCTQDLDSPSEHCEHNMSIRRGETRRLRVVTVVGRRCAIRIAAG
jgi:hypothetical protein